MLGQSGCGKTTTLRAIAGLETIDNGDILIDGKRVQDIKAADRDIAFVFQSFSLYPHMTVYENMAFPLRAVRQSTSEIDASVKRMAEVLQIGKLLNKRPSALSGGDMQRVAIGRALVRSPKALLMDEPIGALDAKLREEMRAEIKRLHIKQGSTTIYVTHDQVEAMSLADRIVIMHEGVLQQVGTPDEVYTYPANLFVAQFVGSPVMNIADVAVSANGKSAKVQLKDHAEGFTFPNELANRLNSADGKAGQLALGIRPEGVIVSRESEGYHARRGAYHRAARFARHCRSEGWLAVPARAHPQRLCGEARREGACAHRPGAGAFLRSQDRQFTGDQTLDGSDRTAQHLQEVRQPHRASRSRPDCRRWRVLRVARPDRGRQDDDACGSLRALKSRRRGRF